MNMKCLYKWLAPLSIMAGLMSGPAMAADKLIISGASGQLGELTVKELLKRGVKPADLILVSRTPDKLAEYARQGASVRYGDLTKPESLPDAYKGGHRMLLISIGLAEKTPRPELHNNGFQAAVKAGVKHIVYTSFIGADTGTSGLAVDHRQSEEKLKASGAKWTLLRNGLYADRVVQQAIEMAKTGKVTVQANEARSAPVTREDCAAAAAGALLNSKFENTAFDITGPAAFGTADIAAEVSAITGKRVEIVQASADVSGMGAGPMSPATVTNAVAELSGRPATSLNALLQANKAKLLEAVK